MATNDVLDRLEALMAAATPGPWFRGKRWQTAGTHPPIDPTRPTCCYCDRSEPAEVTPYDPTRDDSRYVVADWKGSWHRHPSDDPGTDPVLDEDGAVSSEGAYAHRVEGPTGQPVCSNYDYESGGVVNIPDAELIVALRNAAPALIRLARAAAILADDASSTAGGTLLRDGLKALGEVRL